MLNTSNLHHEKLTQFLWAKCCVYKNVAGITKDLVIEHPDHQHFLLPHPKGTLLIKTIKDLKEVQGFLVYVMTRYNICKVT